VVGGRGSADALPMYWQQLLHVSYKQKGSASEWAIYFVNISQHAIH
jgi:hypothetical protein